jgi:hypothetical protein
MSKETFDYFENTIQVYFSMKVKVYVIQEGPVHNIPSYHSIDIYKNLFDRGQLTDANLKKSSCSRKDYIKQQAKYEQFFSKYKEIRGLTFIHIDDVVCDEELCQIGTGEQPFYSDVYHMTSFGVLRLKDRLKKFISF